MTEDAALTDIKQMVGNSATCWRILHMMVTNYGSHPMGQFLIALTLNVLHKNGYQPTVDELTKVTGLPKSSVSRYVSWQINNGYLTQQFDPNDRRSRQLLQTDKAKEEMQWLDHHLNEISAEVNEMADRATEGADQTDPQRILEHMERLTNAAEKRYEE
jgi:DNA-binding MarR family transcriptional regulator